MNKIKETESGAIARYIQRMTYADLDPASIEQLKRHLLDALGSLIFATGSEPIQKLIRQMRALGSEGPCRVPVLGTTAFDRAAQLYTALIRYPDFMDNFLGKEATCHPSDNIGALLAISQWKATSGQQFLLAMAIAYEIECRLVLEIPVMKEGIDHTLLLGYSLVGGVAKIMGLSTDQIVNALGITGCSISPMVTSRASYTYEWKGLASSLDAMNALGFCLLAREGLTGPHAIFSGPKGFDEVFGMKLDYNWDLETFGLIRRCVLKKFNAEVHAQPALEALTNIMAEHRVPYQDVSRIDVHTFLTAYHIIGSGAYGDRKTVHSKEQADHSLFYTIAALLIDGQLYPEQFSPERINRADVQNLLQKVHVSTGVPFHSPVTLAGILDPYTQAYPDEVRAKVSIQMNDGKKFEAMTSDYPGFFTRPFTDEMVNEKFRRLTAGIITEEKQRAIVRAVQTLDHADSLDALIDLLCL